MLTNIQKEGNMISVEGNTLELAMIQASMKVNSLGFEQVSENDTHS